MICKLCDESFVLLRDKPGYVNICPLCTFQNPVEDEPEKLMAEVSWEGKHTPIIRVTTAYYARRFNNAIKRNAGFNACLPFASKTEPEERLACGTETIGAKYRTTLNESRTVK